QPASILTDFDIQRIAQCVKNSLQAEITMFIDAKVSEAVNSLVQQVSILNAEITNLKEQVSSLSLTQENLQQYSRRHNVRVCNVPEVKDEITDDLVLKVAKDAGSGIGPEDINRSHRTGPQRNSVPGKLKHRDILVQFSTKLKSTFLRDLIPARRNLAYQCRALKNDKNSPICDTWTHDGKVFIKTRWSSHHCEQLPRPFE
ncbi:hypothetical protein MAR_018962, partial [Mya arenaria]